MKTTQSPRIGIVSHRSAVSALTLVVSGLLVVIPADALTQRRHAVEANAKWAAAVGQRLAETEAAEGRALGDRLTRTGEESILRVEHDFQRLFHWLRAWPKTEVQNASVEENFSARLPSHP